MTKKQQTLSLQDEFNQLDCIKMSQLREMSRAEVHVLARRAHQLARDLNAIPDSVDDTRALNDLWHKSIKDQVAYMAEMLNHSQQALLSATARRRPRTVGIVPSPFAANA